MRKWFFGLLAMLALVPPPAACQTGSATVTVVDRSRLRVEVTPRLFTGEINDTITFTAIARDTVTNTVIPVVIRWTSQDTTGVRIDALTGRATLRRAGTFQVLATVQRITAMIIMQQQPNASWREVFTNERQAYYSSTGIIPPRLEINGPTCRTWNANGVPNGRGGWTTPPTCGVFNADGGQATLCAYFETEFGEHYKPPSVEWRSGNPLIASVTQMDPSLCPAWAPGMPFPTAAIQLPNIELYRGLTRVG